MSFLRYRVRESVQRTFQAEDLAREEFKARNSWNNGVLELPIPPRANQSCRVIETWRVGVLKFAIIVEKRFDDRMKQ